MRVYRVRSHVNEGGQINATHFDSNSYLSAAITVRSPSCKYPADAFLYQNTITASSSLQINKAKHCIWSTD